MPRITPFLWFDDKAEEAVNYYVSIFKNSKIVETTHYSEAASKAAGRPKGSVMTIAFQLDGQDFSAINAGPHFKFTEAISFVVNCDSQEEIDYYWDRLSKGGDEKAQQCGWLKDKYGMSWQITPRILPQLMNDRDPVKAQRVMQAVLQMKKIDLNVLKAA